MTKNIQVILVFAAVVLLVASQAQGQCRNNQQYVMCGTACPPKCNSDGPNICNLQCAIVRCQCNPGYLLNANGDCVTPAEC